jgi:hypothetical protein
VVVKPAVIVKLREYLLVWENALVAREHGMVEAEHALGRARMECDAIHDRAGGIQ